MPNHDLRSHKDCIHFKAKLGNLLALFSSKFSLIIALFNGSTVQIEAFYFKSFKDCLIIIRTLILLSLFAVNFHAFNSESGEV